MARRKPEEAAETRRLIVAAARRLFAEQGYAATSTRDIVEETGVSRGALYHHFDDKAALFRAVFVDIEHELDATVAAAARRAGRDPRRAMLAACRAYVEFARRPDYRRIAMADAPGVLGHDEWHAIDAGIGLAAMERGLAAFEHAGLLRVPPSRALAIVLFGALTEAGLAAARGDAGAGELLDAFLLLLESVAPSTGASADE